MFSPPSFTSARTPEGEARREAAARAVQHIRAGALGDRVNELGARRRPLLVLAVETGEPDLVDAILAAGARDDVMGDDGTPALYVAASLGLASVVARLLDAGAPADARAPNRETPLMAAAAFGDLESVRRLLDAGADARARVRGRSAVGYARGLHKKAIRALVEARAAGRC
jgi:ankyrin repeat protein